MTDAERLRSYFWLIALCSEPTPPTFSTICLRWKKEFPNEGPLNKPKFDRIRNALKDAYGISIVCTGHPKYQYKFEKNNYNARNVSVAEWMLSSLSPGTSIINSDFPTSRIMLESIPEGCEYLNTIIDAINNNLKLRILYQKFGENTINDYIVCPYGIKLFLQRWYLVAHSPKGDDRVYSLDRVKLCELTDENFVCPKDFSMEKFFEEYYGVFHMEEVKLQKIKLRTYGKCHYYIESVPLHHSQTIIEVGKIPLGGEEPEYVDFEYNLRPTFDFKQKLFTYLLNSEILEPASLREEMKIAYEHALHFYDRKEK